MIVPMKKVTLLMRQGDAAQAVQELARLGVLHVEHQRSVPPESTAALQEQLRLVDAAMAVYAQADALPRPGKAANTAGDDNWQLCARKTVELWKHYEQLATFGRTLQSAIARWEPWGDFDPQKIKALAGKGLLVKLYEIPVRELPRLPASVVFERIFTRGGISGCLVVSRAPQQLPFAELALPAQGLDEMRRRLSADRSAREEIVRTIRDAATQHYAQLQRVRRRLLKELELVRSRAGMGQEGAFAYIGGFVPFDAVPPLSAHAHAQGWGMLVEEPGPEDMVPTLVRNGRFVSFIRPVFQLIEVVPGYRELDISLWFLIFLSLFFGILIGDAGYGLVYLGLTRWAQCAVGRKAKERHLFSLLYLLGASAVVWGVCTATFFGQAWLAARGIRPLVPLLGDDQFVRSLCFFIGAVHLSIAHLWRFFVKMPSAEALADIGWIAVLWAAFFLARVLILGAGLPAWFAWLLVPGLVLVVLFSSPRRNLLAGIGSGLGVLALNLMNNFTDVVSYIRLFAVGLAGVALADAFNAMAGDVASAGPLGFAASFLVVFAGHVLNIVLGPMSVLVHGIRLNVLEFCSHLDVKWSGFVYAPLSDKTV